MKKYAVLTALAAMSFVSSPASAQASTSQQSSQRNPLEAILGAIFGDRQGGTASLEAQWSAGRTPLTNQRSQFESRVDAEVRSGSLAQATGAQLKSDYLALVQLEARYGADRRYTAQEQADLAARYGDLTNVLAVGGYADGNVSAIAVVADGRTEFNRRVDAAVSARRLSRTQGTRLKSDYSAVIQLEAGYLRDGVFSVAEQSDLDARLDALDVQVGDTSFAAPITPRSRLDAIARALPSSGLASAALNQLRVEHEDLSRLEAAYARINVSAEERAYLDRRLADLESRARVRR
jgi:hypothetical protein